MPQHRIFPTESTGVDGNDMIDHVEPVDPVEKARPQAMREGRILN